MNDIVDIKNRIIEALYNYNANELPSICVALGMEEGTVEEAFRSKKSYIRKRLFSYDKRKIEILLEKLSNQLDINLYPNKVYSYKLTEITIRDIIDILINGIHPDGENGYIINWHGILDEWEFISKACNLDKIPPIYGYNSFKEEYQKHRINNYDYDDDWFFTDKRFPFQKGPDSDILNIICFMFHPLVRKDVKEIDCSMIYDSINNLINTDGFELYVTKQISGRDVFGWRKIQQKPNSFNIQITNNIKEKLSSKYINGQIDVMVTNIDNNPNVAIGKAKELIEAILKRILEECGVPYEKNIKLPKLDKKVRDLLCLDFTDKTDKQKSIPGVKNILGSLSNITCGMAELRNSYGDGHGKGLEFRQLPPRYAHLAVSAASAYAIFLYDTFDWLRDNNKLPLNNKKSDKH